MRERELAATQAELGEPRFEAAWVAGRALAHGDALDRALRAVAG